jgi:hypothetical protein
LKVQRALNRLRRRCPLKGRARVAVVPHGTLKSELGRPLLAGCDPVVGGFEIKMERGPADVMLESLTHEWAHAMSFKPGQRRDHSMEWGRAYVLAYRAAYDDES